MLIRVQKTQPVLRNSREGSDCRASVRKDQENLVQRNNLKVYQKHFAEHGISQNFLAKKHARKFRMIPNLLVRQDKLGTSGKVKLITNLDLGK